MNKKISSCILTVLLILALAVPAFAAPLNTYSTWAEFYIRDADTLIHILPDSLKDCDYKQPITRNEFCEIAYETLGYMTGYIAYYDAWAKAEESGETDYFENHLNGITRIYPAVTEGNSPFSDTDSTSITALNEAGIILGKGNNKFAPEAALTREEAATIIERMSEYCSLQNFGTDLTFSDADQISSWAVDGVKSVCGMGIMVGMNDNTFSPSTEYTREQSIATMIRLVDSVPYLCNKEKVSDGLYCIFNSFWGWIEDAERNIIFKLPRYYATYDYRTDYGYSSWSFFEHDSKVLMAAWGSSEPSATPHTTLFDAATGRTLLSLPAKAKYFYALSKDKKYLIMQDSIPGTEPGDWGRDVYGVYDFNGKELLPVTHEWIDLYNAGYVDNEHSVFYVWK